MKHSKPKPAALFRLLLVTVLLVLFSSFNPAKRKKNVYEDEHFTVHYETRLGRLDGHYVSWYRNGTKRSEGYFESNHRTGTWTVHDSTGRIRMQRHYTDLFTFTRLIPEVPGDPPVKLLNTSPYQLIRNQHNYYGYFNLEERMVIWATRIWRRLTPPLNQHLFTDRMLFHHMLHHWQNEDITLYQDEDFRIPITAQIEANQYEVIAYKIIEDCVFDIERLVSETRILAICPVVVDRESLDTLDLFWIYIPHYRKFMAQQPLSGSAVGSRVQNLDDLLFFRSFHGEIYKGENLYDRPISDYKKGEEIALEAQRIEISLIEDEHTIWISLTQ